nr:PREDICTED: uncharacterized protein LOC104945929 [Notothenia coriiceps]
MRNKIVISDTEDMGPPKTNTDKTTCYSTYTDLYAPCVEEEDEELVAVNMTSLLDTEMEGMNIILPAIIANLSQPIDHGRVSRFNISRANVWDGAVRGFKRTSYSENCDMLVKFTDDAGVTFYVVNPRAALGQLGGGGPKNRRARRAGPVESPGPGVLCRKGAAGGGNLLSDRRVDEVSVADPPLETGTTSTLVPAESDPRGTDAFPEKPSLKEPSGAYSLQAVEPGTHEERRSESPSLCDPRV